jgi:hypothetical protein
MPHVVLAVLRFASLTFWHQKLLRVVAIFGFWACIFFALHFRRSIFLALTAALPFVHDRNRSLSLRVVSYSVALCSLSLRTLWRCVQCIA